MSLSASRSLSLSFSSRTSKLLNRSSLRERFWLSATTNVPPSALTHLQLLVPSTGLVVSSSVSTTPSSASRLSPALSRSVKSTKMSRSSTTLSSRTLRSSKTRKLRSGKLASKKIPKSSSTSSSLSARKPNLLTKASSESTSTPSLFAFFVKLSTLSSSISMSQSVPPSFSPRLTFTALRPVISNCASTCTTIFLPLFSQLRSLS